MTTKPLWGPTLLATLIVALATCSKPSEPGAAPTAAEPPAAPSPAEPSPAAPSPAAAPAAAAAPALEIVSALWGLDNTTIDVAPIIRQALERGDRAIGVSYTTLGDPVPNKTKILKLTYKVDGAEHTKEIRGGNNLIFADLTRTVTDSTGVAALPESSGPPVQVAGGVEVVRALWGLNDQQIDVLEKLRQAVLDAKTTIPVTYQNLGDPVQKVQKRLTLDLRVNGKKYTRVYAERSTLTFSELADVKGLTPISELSTIQLTAQDPRMSVNGSTIGSLLVRELERQAVLIAARDEMGLTTRDMALQEPFAKDDATTGTFLFGSQNWVDGEMQLFLDLPGGPGGTDAAAYPKIDITAYSDKSPDKVLLRTRTQVKKGPLLDYLWITNEMESRSRQPFLAALKKAGIAENAARKTKWVANGTVPADVPELLGSMDEIAQFLAVRKVHEEITKSGASPELMEALIRGYANLAFLTQTLYSGAHKTYMARSLLYAERWVAHDPASAQALYLRGYARGMAGLAKAALDDFEAAKKLPGAAGPEWLPIIDALCHYDLAKMNQLTERRGPFQPLAQTLGVAISADCFARETLIQLGINALQTQPTNLWLMHHMFNNPQLGTARMTADLMQSALPLALEKLAPKIAASAGNPPIKFNKSSATPYSAVADYCSALESAAAKDTGEPSLGALAAILRDEQFLAVYTQAKVIRNFIGFEAEQVREFTKQSEPAWIHHPLAGLVEMLGIDRGVDPKAWRAALDKVNPVDAENWYYEEVIRQLGGQDYVDKWYIWTQAQAHGDMLPMNQSQIALGTERLNKDRFIDAMRDISPYAALPMLAWMENDPVKKMESDPKAANSIVAEAVQKFGDRDQMVVVAAKWAEGLRNLTLAEHILMDAQKSHPSLEISKSLLEVYKRSHDMVKAKQIVEAVLKMPSYGLENAAVAGDFAEMLMADNQDADALKYATIAADTYSGWGLICLAQVQDRLGNFAGTESTLRALSERYPGNEMRWYAWSKFRKRPNIAPAEKAAKERIATHEDDILAQAVLYSLNGEHAKALEFLKTNQDKIGNNDWNYYAIVAAQNKNQDEIDLALKQLARIKGYEDQPEYQAMKSGATNGEIEELVTHVELLCGPPRENVGYTNAGHLGRFLAATGHRPQAIRLLARAVSAPWATEGGYALAWLALEGLGEDPAKLIKAYRVQAINKSALTGAWKVQAGEDADLWTFDADNKVKSNNSDGLWWEDTGRLMVRFADGKCATFTLPLDARLLRGDLHHRLGRVTLTKQ